MCECRGMMSEGGCKCVMIACHYACFKFSSYRTDCKHFFLKFAIHQGRRTAEIKGGNKP